MLFRSDQSDAVGLKDVHGVADLMDVGAHEVRHSAMPQTRDGIPGRRRQKMRNSHAKLAHETDFQFARRHIAYGQDRGSRDHENRETKHEEAQLRNPAIDAKNAEDMRHCTLNAAAARSSAYDHREERDEQNDADTFDKGAKQHEDEGLDALASGEPSEVPQKRAQGNERGFRKQTHRTAKTLMEFENLRVVP